MQLHHYLLLMILLASCQTSEDTTEVNKQPNIIFLLTDDQRWDALGAMGNDQILTPNLDLLAGPGIIFKNAYVTTPICAVSRASFFSGQYARRHGIHGFSTMFSDSTWQDCYPELMRQAGYENAFIGKFGVGRAESMPASSFEYWRGIPGQPKYEQTDENGEPIHLTKLLGMQCDTFLRARDVNRPFCLSVSFKAPHVQDNDPRQFIIDSAYADILQDVDIPPPPDPDAYPTFFADSNEARLRWHMRFSDEEHHKRSVKDYYRLIYGVDQVLGNIRKTLRELDIENETIIIFTSDNGFFLGEKGLAGKWYAYEPSIRIPMIIYDPNATPQTRDEMVLNIDIAPTILTMAGITPPEVMQGRTLTDLYEENSPAPWRTEFLFEHLFKHNRIPKSEGIIRQDGKYVRYPDLGYAEVYDLEKDPREMQNLWESLDESQQMNWTAILDELIQVSK